MTAIAPVMRQLTAVVSSCGRNSKVTWLVAFHGFANRGVMPMVSEVAEVTPDGPALDKSG